LAGSGRKILTLCQIISCFSETDFAGLEDGNGEEGIFYRKDSQDGRAEQGVINSQAAACRLWQGIPRYDSSRNFPLTDTVLSC
jgi:hypothetical protein